MKQNSSAKSVTINPETKQRKYNDKNILKEIFKGSKEFFKIFMTYLYDI